MSTNTPTPWECEGGDIFVISDRLEIITSVFGYDNAHPEIREEKNDNENNANAEHIVRCVNAHDELVAALADALDYIYRMTDSAPTDPDDIVPAPAVRARAILTQLTND